MAKPRHPNREAAKQKWLEEKGNITSSELADIYNVSATLIRKWKATDKWDEELNKKKKGGQPGNTNACGHGAPKRNTNAIKDGIYASVFFDELTEREQDIRNNLPTNICDKLKMEYETLAIREKRLKDKIVELEGIADNDMQVSSSTKMISPTKTNPNKITMKMVNETSKFERIQRIEEALTKLHGRMAKVLDSMRAYEIEQQRLEIDKAKLELLKKKATGVFDTDDFEFINDD